MLFGWDPEKIIGWGNLKIFKPCSQVGIENFCTQKFLEKFFEEIFERIFGWDFSTEEFFTPASISWKLGF